MSEFAWNSEVADQPEAEHSEPEEKQLDEPAASAETLALSVNDFSALEEKILRAVNMVKRERQARTAVEERLAKAEEMCIRDRPWTSGSRHSCPARSLRFGRCGTWTAISDSRLKSASSS